MIMFRRNLFKHALLKHALPVMLSVAMAFQSMPVTALASESQAAEETAADENTQADNIGENAVGAPESGAGQDAGTDTASGAEASETTSETDAPASGGQSQATEEESVQGTGETTDGETQSSAIETDDDETETTAGIAAEGETTTQPAEDMPAVTTSAARIVLDDRKADAYAQANNGFTRVLGENDLHFITEYVSDSKCSAFQQAVDSWIHVEVDGEPMETLKDRLTYKWVRKAAAEGETDTPFVNAFPTDAGSYTLTVSMDLSGVDSICSKLEKDLTVLLTIEKAETELVFDRSVVPGKTAAEYIEEVNENCIIRYKDGKYNVSRDILAAKDTALPLLLFVVDESGERRPMDAAERFGRDMDYVLTIGDIALTEHAAGNYSLTVEESYRIKVGERQKTQVRFTRKDAGEDLIQIYSPEKAWTVDEVAKDLFAEAVTDETGAVTKAGGAPTVFVQDKDGGFDTVLEGAVPEAAWYTRIRLNSGSSYKVDEEAGEIADGEYVYKPVEAEPADAGEYYIIWRYPGDEGAYEKSHSEAVRFTIDPAPVVIKIDPASLTAANFRDGMTAADVTKALSAISYGVYPMVKNEGTGTMEAGSEALETAPDFWGTSYSGSILNSDKDKTQYYVPEFILERRVASVTRKDEEPVDVDPRTVEWEEVTGALRVVTEDADELKEIDLPDGILASTLESAAFTFRVRFTGYKVLYDNDGKKLQSPKGRLLITDVTTNSADRNHLVDITSKTLEDTALAVPVEGMRTERVQIVTDDIVTAFMADNKESLEPQADSGADGGIRQGTLENPAAKIYDQKALFGNRASYKQAKVYQVSADGGIGDALPVASTDDVLSYTWSYATLDSYEAFLKKWDAEQRQYRDFDEFLSKNEGELGWTDAADGTFDTFKGVGFYRLTVTYNDPEYVYQSAKAAVYFKVVRQEVIVVPVARYVKDGENISSMKRGLGKVNKEDFTIYKLPHNSMEEYNALTDDSRGDYALPTDEEIAAYGAENGHQPDMELAGVQWQVLRKAKDPASGQDKEPAEWIPADGTVFDRDFTYGVVVHWTGRIAWLEGNDRIKGFNYTTWDEKTYQQTEEERHRESVAPVSFYDQQIYVEADAEKIKALGHVYDGEPVDLNKVVQALGFFTDEALTEESRIPAESIVNTGDSYDPAKINIYWVKDGKWYENKNAVYGGTYTLGLRYEGGALRMGADAAASAQDGTASVTYAPLSENGRKLCTEVTLTVSPREITITPKTLPTDILYAGEKADALLTEGIDVQGIVEKDQVFFDYAEIAAGSFDVTWDGKNEDGTDKEGFAYKYNIDKKGGYPAFNGAASYIIQRDDREIKAPDKEYLRFGGKYTIKLTNNLVSPLQESYTVAHGTAAVVIDQRGSADITAINSTLSAKGIAYDFDGATYTIKPRGAVKFYDSKEPQTVIGRNGKETLQDTNILGFQIYAPKEYWNDFGAAKEHFVYQNAIWNAGGYFLSSDTWNQNRYIKVVFPLTEEDTAKTFCITWEDGYTETFTLADVVLADDFTKAVAPKSMAFNGVVSKMAVGERQQLNLKITKAQMGDVIRIRYRIKGGATKNEYISLDPETGAVTALRAGKEATVIEAYPVYENADGEFVPVRDSKGKEAKAASTKITVREVTASSVKKITALDESAKLYFTVPDDGYRREIYVVDVTKGTAYENRKKWKPADFDTAIADMKNGQWKAAGFAVQPVYSYAKNEKLDAKALNREYDKKFKAHIEKIAGIEAGHEYIFYVRNVSAARMLDDGSVVALSAGGAVKKFKTTKPQVQDLALDFTIKTSEADKKNTVTHPVNPDGTIDMDTYTVELSAKKAQLNVYGYFSDRAGGNDAAEQPDQRKYSLVPTLKEEKAALKNYLMPKLGYTIYDSEEDEPFEPGLEQSRYARISNKGLITLKGVDLNGRKTVYIYVRDNTQHEYDYGYDAQIALTITAVPASVAGKKVKMTVGQTIRLSDCLEYKDAKKKKIPDYRSCGITMTKEMIAAAKENGFEIKDVGADRLEHDWEITAVFPNKAGFDLAVTDFDADGSPMETTVKLTSAQIGAVKGLKVTYVDNRSVTVTFTHPANSNEADDGSVYDYAVEVKDARGNVVDKVVIANPYRISDIDNVDAKELKNALSWLQYKKTDIDEATGKVKVDGSSTYPAFNYYTGTRAKTKTFAYTFYNTKLVKLSSYTISVTPLYRNQKAEKTATVRTKTTNLPTSYNNVDLTGDLEHRLGGCSINIYSYQLYKDDPNQNNYGKPITKPYRFIAGNIYTLSLGIYNISTKERVCDPLTWKSSNTKVATVKGNPGTFSATFKTLSPGTTTISLTSKITKKVIARWMVTVYAVKDGSGYGGDYEPAWNSFYEKILALYDPDYEGRLEVLSEDVPLVIKNDDPETETWVSFTAPHYGTYRFQIPSNTFYDGSDGRVIADKTNKIFLEKNQKVYFRVKGNRTVTVTGSELVRLTKAHTKESPLEVKAGSDVTFTAWEDNVYTFYQNGNKLEDKKLRAGETDIFNVKEDGNMYVTCREEVAAEELKLGSHPTSTVELDMDNQVRYVSFTAGTAGVYTFAYKETDGVVVNFTTAAGDAPVRVEPDITNGAEETVRSFRLAEGEKLVIEWKAVPEITDAEKRFTVSVTVTGAEQRRKIEGTTIAIPKGTTEIVEYAVPSFTTEKAQFYFGVNGEEGSRIEKYYDKDYDEVDIEGDCLTVSKTSAIQAGDSMYIQVTAGNGAEGDTEAKDAALTVTQVPVTAITDTAAVTIDNDTRQWYTFTAPKDGYYAFGATVAARASEDTTPMHTVSVDICKELFGSADVAASVKTEKILSMKTGEKLALRLNHNTVADIVKDDGTTVAVKSDVTVSVKTLDIQRLVLDEEKTVEPIAAESQEVRYYSFTASVRADYTISWKPADAAKDNANVTFLTSPGSTQSSVVQGSYTRTLNAGETGYIKVRANDAESANPASGALLVTAANLRADALTAGAPYSFTLEDKDEKGAKQIVRFTAEEEGVYEIATTVGENPVDGLSYAYPEIKTSGGIAVETPYGSVSLKKGETVYLTLSFSAKGSVVRETKGTITISSKTKELVEESTEISVPKDSVQEYIFTIPETGRYEFRADYDKEKASVQWAYADGSYLMKNTKVKATVTGLDETAGASVKLYRPALIHTSVLSVGMNPIAIETGKTQYYELSVNTPVNYSFDVSAIEDGKAGISMERVMNKENTWRGLSDGASVSMKKDDRMIIKMSSASAKKDASCVLNVTSNTELKLGGNELHLEAGETVGLTYHAYETGYYSFNVNQPGGQLVLKADGITTVGDSFYDIAKLNAKGARSYTLTNEGSSAADVTVTMKAVEPVAVEPGKDEPAATDVSIAAGEWAHFALRTFKKGTYAIKIADAGKGADLKVYLGNVNAAGELKKAADGVYLEKDLNGETLLRIQNDGLQETKVTVKVTLCEAQPLPQEPVTLGRNESMLVSFVAPEENRYFIAKDNKQVTMTLVSRNGEPRTGTVEDYTEELLDKGDKIVYRLAYEPAETDKNTEASQTVTARIAPVQPVIIEEEAVSVTIAENDSRTVWYQLTAKEDATYTFALEDTYHNPEDVTFGCRFYRDIKASTSDNKAEQYLKAGEKIFIKAQYTEAGTYTLSYTMMKAATETGTTVLDFSYTGEEQEVKFVVPRGGIYKITAAAIRGKFKVAGRIGGKEAFGTFNASGSRDTVLFNQGDIVTITITANQAGKSSVSLRIEEVSVADTLEPGREVSGLTDTAKDRYYEMRVKEKALYAVTAGGEPAVTYVCTRNGAVQGETALNGTDYVDLDVNDRIILKVPETESEKLYTVRIEKVDAISLDGKNTEESPFAADEVENAYYGFTTGKAYVRYTVPEDGDYYIAVQTVNDAVSYDGQVTDTPSARTGSGETGIQTLAKGQTVTFTFTNNMPKDENAPEKEYSEAVFRFTLKKVAAASDNAMNAGEPKSGTLAAKESVSFQFTAAEAGRYVIGFNGSNCVLDGEWNDGKRLAKDESITLTIENTSEKAGSYELTVTKLTPIPLILGEPAETLLAEGEAVLYEFTAKGTESDGAMYQFYSNKAGFLYTVINADGEVVYERNDANYGNFEYELKENDKVELLLEHGHGNVNIRMTVKKVEYIPIKLGETVTNDLEWDEKAYYVFTSEDDAPDGTEYRGVLDNEKVVFKLLNVAEMGEDGTLQKPTLRFGFPITLKKGEKLLMDVMGDLGQPGKFSLTMEKTAEPEIPYEPIALNETKLGKLEADGKAGYEFTADDASEDGTLYSVYFGGASCGYSRTTTVTDADGTAKEEVTSGTLRSGSNEFTWKKGDKIRFTASNAGKYELTVKKAAYTPLMLDTTVSKTLRTKETAYYQFTAQDEPETGATETLYQVYGTARYTVEKVTTKEDGTTTTEPVAAASEYRLQKGQMLHFKVTNGNSVARTFQLTIKKAVYAPMSLGKAAEGRLKSGEYAYYQFTSQDDPAQGETATKYHVYGNAEYTVRKVSKNEDGTMTAVGMSKASEYDLEKGQSLQFTVTSSGSPTEGYDLTIVKYEERAITVDSMTETGRLGKGQKAVYVFSYEGEKPADYAVSFQQKEHVTVTVEQNGSALDDAGQKVTLSKGDKLTITVSAAEDVDNFTFSLNRLVPEAITLGTRTDLKKLSAGKTAYYQYTVGEDGSYVIAMTESHDGALSLDYEITRADGTGTETGTVSGNIKKLADLKKDDVILFRVSVSGTTEVTLCSFRLLLQKAAAGESAAALPWNGTLQPGEVKQLRFTVPEAEKEDTLGYYIILTGSADVKYCHGDVFEASRHGFIDTAEDLELIVANTSMYSALDCSIEVQKKEILEMGTYTGTLEPDEYRYFTFPGESTNEDVLYYYFKNMTTNKCTIEVINSHNEWNPFSYGMNTHSSAYVARVRNNDAKNANTYSFELRNAWRDNIADVFQKDYELDREESVYFEVTAPEDKELFVSISNAQLNWYGGTDKAEVNTVLSKGAVYGMTAGAKHYFKVENGYSKASFTMNVKETSDMIPLELNARAAAYISSGQYARYEFEAPEEGTYFVLVEGDIKDVSHRCLYYTSDGKEEELVNLQTFDLAANDRITLRIENQSTTVESRRCSVQMMKVTAMELNVPNEILLETYGEVYCLAVPVESAGYYVINGQVTETSGGNFLARCLNLKSTYDTNIFYNSSYPSYANRNLPTILMETGETIYIKVWKNSFSSYNPSTPYNKSITITVTLKRPKTDS